MSDDTLRAGGRALTPAQKSAIVERILAAWAEVPTLRLGQLVHIATAKWTDYGRDAGWRQDIFDIEDDALAAAIEDAARKTPKAPAVDDELPPLSPVERIAESFAEARIAYNEAVNAVCVKAGQVALAEALPVLRAEGKARNGRVAATYEEWAFAIEAHLGLVRFLRTADAAMNASGNACVSMEERPTVPR